MSPADQEHAVEFWIDAICINQDDPQERAVQVNMMSDIYQKADEVVIWLGEAEESTPLACELVSKLGSLSQEERNSLSFESLATDMAMESPLGELHTLTHWQGLLDLFSRTWFTRCWVIQEFVLARRVAVICGNIILDWHHLEIASDYLATRVSRSSLNSLLGNDFDIESSSYRSPAKLEAVKRDIGIHHPATLLRSLIRCRDLDCCKTEDKIYSLLGIHEAITKTPLSPNDRLYPNYTLEASRVYVHAAVEILKQESGINLLMVAEGEDFRLLKDLPSWVPDWSCSVKRTSLGLGITGYERYDATASLKHEIAFSEDETVLFIKAAKLDNIVLVGETKEDVERGGRLDRWVDIVESLEPVYHTGESRFEVFWRTLITNTTSNGRYHALDNMSIGFSEWLHQRTLSHPLEFKERLSKVFPAFETSHENSVLKAEYELQYSHSLNLRLFSTSQGYIGVGSRSMREHGVRYSVWMVSGARVPLIFQERENSKFYSLIGGAYVHGFMQGEALNLPLHFEMVGLE